MADKGIIFSAPMVRALLAGTKTQTRRLIKPQPPAVITSAGVYSNSREGQIDRWTWLGGDPRDCDTWEVGGDFKTGYAPGDRLYVREGWRVGYGHDWYREDLGRCPKPSEYDPKVAAVEYLADDTRQLGGRSHPSIHMPRWASRLTLTVTEVRVQRLQEISEEDAKAEGIDEDAIKHFGDPIKAYAALWNHLHGAENDQSWEANPWIVAVSFSVRKGNIDHA